MWDQVMTGGRSVKRPGTQEDPAGSRGGVLRVAAQTERPCGTNAAAASTMRATGGAGSVGRCRRVCTTGRAR
jgi:hypothetical protein